MKRSEILAAVDGEIYRLEQLRAQMLAPEAVAAKKHNQRILTAEGRKRISEAQHRRWAGVRAARGSKTVATY